MTETLSHIAAVDLAFLAILALSVIVGLMRGLVFEVLSLAGWVAAYFAAQWFTPEVAPHIPVGKAGSGLNYGAAFAITFIVALIVWSLLSRLIRMLIHATPLSVVDRILGAGFGLARGLVVILVITTVVMLTSLAHGQAWRESRGAAWAAAALRNIKGLLPPQLAEHLPR